MYLASAGGRFVFFQCLLGQSPGEPSKYGHFHRRLARLFIIITIAGYRLTGPHSILSSVNAYREVQPHSLQRRHDLALFV